MFHNVYQEKAGFTLAVIKIYNRWMLDFIIVLFCLAINAFFSAYEMAFVTVTRDELDDLESEAQSILTKINFFKKKPERTLSVIQIGISLVGAIAAAVGGTGAVENLEPYFVKHFDFSTSLAEALSVAIVIIPLTYFSVVFGELVPKTIALKNPIQIILLGTNILNFIDRFLSPIVTFLEVSTNFFLKILGLHEKNDEDESLGESIEIGNLPGYHQKFVQNLVSLKGRKVNKVMIPWTKVCSLDFSDNEDEIRTKLASTPHARYPVTDGDTIVGILLKKDLPDAHMQFQIPWQGILRNAIIVNETDKVLEAFLKMQESQTPLAIVNNEEHKYVGIITIEDILEGIVGDINDKTDNSMTSKMLSSRQKINITKNN